MSIPLLKCSATFSIIFYLFSSNVVLENAKNVSSSPVRSRLQITLSSMISLLIYYRDILQQLQLNDVTSVHSFEWQRIVKYVIIIQ